MENIIGIILWIFDKLLSIFPFWKKEYKKYYSITWKESSSLIPEDILGFRGEEKYGFREYYKNRYHDHAIKDNIEKGESILIIGNPLSGKTRAVYEALKKLNEPVDVIIPRVVNIDPEDFRIPKRFFSRRKKLLILDDIDKFFEKNNFIQLLNEFDNEKTVIVATCRSGTHIDIFRTKMERENYPSFNVQEEIKKISDDEGEKVAKETVGKLPPTFDGNIGSIFLPLEAMIKRFKESADEEKCVLRSIGRLYFFRIYEQRETFSINRIKRVCEEREEIEKKRHEWTALFDKLKDNGFIEIYEDEIQIEEAYLYFIIEDQKFPLKDFREMLDIFSGDPEALYSLGNRAYDIGEVSLDKVKIMNLAIKAYKGALKVWTKKTDPIKYGWAKNGLGNSYGSLSEVEDQVNNVNLAIEAYNDALRVRTFNRFPAGYAMTQNNLGTAYSTLSEIVDTEGNAKLAIKAYSKALKVYGLDRFPFQYATTQNNLGTAYSTLSEIVDTEGNAKLAIKAYSKALKVYTLDRFPMDYAMTQNNLGNAYQTLSDVLDKEKNAKLAIKAYYEALKVRTFDLFPIQYAMTQNNLGSAYQILCKVLDKEKNAKLAIKAFHEALKIHTLERFPIQYAKTQGNIGISYSSLAEAGNRSKNCKKAREAFGEAQKVFTEEKLPLDYQKLENLIRKLNEICKEK